MTTYLDKLNSLTPKAQRVIRDKATEYPHTGQYNAVKTQGTYLCRRCGLALFRADSQFGSGCGWPGFDVQISGTIQEIPDADGIRTEILCNRCRGHLGHVFKGEQLTEKNTRFCVNSLSIDYVSNSTVVDTEEVIVAGGCFWGVEYYLSEYHGVLKAESGYTGGVVVDPTYEDICSGKTGHYEAVRVLFDKDKTDIGSVLKRFFEIHDPTQQDGQGPDIGSQYKSAIFYFNDQQKKNAQDLIQRLRKNKHEAVTQLIPAQTFWPAEDYHQQYYQKQQKIPYCHRPVKRFDGGV